MYLILLFYYIIILLKVSLVTGFLKHNADSLKLNRIQLECNIFIAVCKDSYVIVTFGFD